MKIDVRKKGNVNVLDFSGQMKTGEADVQLRDTLQELVEAGEVSFVFNMTEVPWLDSGCLGEVVACNKRVTERNGRVKMVLRGKPHDIFTITGLVRAFEIHDDVDSAVASFAN